jgi:hypothetical protein
MNRLRALPAWVLPAAAAVFLVAFLLPVAHAPFFSDDSTYSEVVGYSKLTGKSLLGFDFQQTWDAVTHGGRPQILSFLQGYWVFAALGNHPGLYHLFILAMTALDGLLLYGLMRRLGAPRAAGALAVVLAAAWMQQRIYHDSMVSFAALAQEVLALVLGSLWCFDRWLADGRRRDLVWAMALFFAACGIYEVAYPLCAAHVGLALTRRRGRAAVGAAAPVVAVAVLFGVVSVLLRHFANAVSTGYSVGGGGPWTVLRTYAVQLVSPLPTINILGDPPGVGGSPTSAELFMAGWRGLAAAAAVGLLGAALLRGRAVRWSPVVVVAAALYVTPPLLLAVAGKYQTELNLSTAYLPVLIQVFALAVLAVAALSGVLRLAAERSREMAAATLAAASLAVGLLAGVTAYNNVRIIGILQPERESRSLVEAAARRDAFDALPAGASVFFFDTDVAWQGPTAFQGYLYLPLMLRDRTGRAYDARLEPAIGVLAPSTCARTDAKVQEPCAPPGPAAAWARVRVRSDGGTVIVAPLARVTPAGYPSARSAPAIAVYREADGGGNVSPPLLTGHLGDGRPWTSDQAAWSRRAGAGGWARWELRFRGPAPVASSIDDQRGIIDFPHAPAPPVRARLLGAKRLLP